MQSRIMIVEDERIIALDLAQNLESFGHQIVAIASSGEQAIVDAARCQPDLVLMDIHLQGAMDGTEAAREIRHTLQIPVIFLTAFTEERTLAQAEQSLPYGYLVKPVESRELGATIRMALARREAERALEKSEERLRLAMDAAQLGVWEWSADSDAFECGGHTAAILGRPPSSLNSGPESFLAFIDPSDRPAVESAIVNYAQISACVRVISSRAESAAASWIDINARPYFTPGSTAPRMVGVMRDVTDERERQGQLQQAEVVFRTTAEGIAILDAQRCVQSVNPAFETLTGHSAADVLGRDPGEFLAARRRHDVFYPDLQEPGRTHWSGEITCLRRDGGTFPAWQNICAVLSDQGEVVNYVVTLADISAIRRAQEEIRHLAFHDALTGLGNRNKLKNVLEAELPRARTHNERVAVLFIDLDGFKLINDTLGHARGDQLLQVVAGRIARLIRRSDTAVRLGGDEFVIVMPGASRLEDCAGLAEKLLVELRTEIELGHERISLTASIGIAVFPEDADNRDDLLKAADNAMYSAKNRSRNRYAFYSNDMARDAHERLKIEQGLGRAIANEELELFYQPVVHMADARLIGFEALIRWRHPQRGMIAPDAFIPIAEECGLIEYIGAWVLRTACQQGRRWMDAGHQNLRLAVNVSVRQMMAEDFVDIVANALYSTGFPAAQLELEITESTLQAVDQSKNLLGRLRALGVSLSIDDFGTGFSSLSLLRHLPIDRIKIDRSFVQDLPDDPNDSEVTRAIVALARILRLELIAEGIETEAQRQFLLDLGCEEAQGFLFSKPLSRDEASSLLGKKPAPH